MSDEILHYIKINEKIKYHISKDNIHKSKV